MLSPDFGDQISLHPSPSPAVVGVNILWLTSLLLDITSALFANIDTAVGTQTRPTAPSSRRVAGRVARSFYAQCNRDDCISPSPFCVPISRWPGGILLHDQQDCGHRCFNHSWTLWSGLFNPNRSCLCTPQLPVSYAIVHRVVVLTDSDV